MQLKCLLMILFGDGYTEAFEYSDDIIRRPTIRTQKTKEYENGDVDYKVTINWQLLNKLLEEDNDENTRS